MSDSTVSMPAQPEPAATEPGRSGRRGLVVGGVVVLVLLLVGGAAVAAWRFFAPGGAQPADVLPANTLGLVSVDLDPSGGQKIEAIRTLRTFPTFREEVGLDESDDPVEVLFERLQADDELCADLDYAADVAPWIGQRFAVAAVPGDDEPQVVVVVQVEDPDAAREGAQALASCATAASGGSGGPGGFVVGEDYLVAAETEDAAQRILDAGEDDPLSGDSDYQEWSDEAGDGIVTMYASPGVGEIIAAAAGDQADADLVGQLEEFSGAAAALRFEDGGVAVSGAFGMGGESVTGGSVVDHVGSLPGDTAAVLAFGSSVESREQIRERLDAIGPGATDDVLGQVEGALASVGLTFPDDLLTVLGDSFSVSVGGEAPASVTSPADVPVGIRIDGDPEAVQDVITRAEEGIGQSLDAQGVVVDSNDDSVALSFQPDYVESLLGGGSLADDDTFSAVIPDLDRAQGLLFVQLTDSWRDLLLDSLGGSSEQTADLEVLRAFGASAHTEGDMTRFQARLALD